MGWLFAHVSFLLPVDRLRNTETLLAFHHPRPAYPVHILIVPKRRLANLLDLQTADADFLLELIATVQSLITNGGPYQDIPQLHFHLISGEVE